MSDAEFLLLILAALYFFGCAFWIQPGGFVFASQLGERHRLWALYSAAFLRNFRGGAVPGNVFPLGEAYLCEQWPLSLSPDGVYGYVAHALSPDGRPPHEEKFIRFEDIERVQVSGRQVHVNGVPFVQTCSAGFAASLTSTLRQLRETPPERRAEAIEAAFAKSLDVEAIARRRREFRARTRALEVACTLTFFHIFVFVPLVIWRGSHINLLQVLAGYFALVGLTALLFRATHKTLFPRRRGERLKQLSLMLISPADVMHARDSLGREALCEFHPLAVAHVLCPRRRYLEFAERVVRDLEYPMLPLCPVDDPGPCATEEWFRVRVRQMLEDFLARTGVKPAELLRPPAPEDETCRTYCPRCLGQYVLAEGICTTCEGRPLLPFAEVGPGKEGEPAAEPAAPNTEAAPPPPVGHRPKKARKKKRR